MSPLRPGEGANEITSNKTTAWQVLLRQFNNPLLIILFVTTTASFFLGDKFSSLIISWMMVLSVGMGFWNEYRAEKTMDDLLKHISFTATVIRNGVKQSLPVKNLRVGDQVLLYPGGVVPADLKLSVFKGLEVNESVLSGESVPVTKNNEDKLVYMGTIVNSGTGQGEVVAIGNSTKFGQLSSSVGSAKPETEFQKGLRSFGVLLVRAISLLGIMIFVFNGLLGRPWLESAMFAITVAIGLTPELLPVIVTVSLSHGAKQLAKKDIIVKQLIAIEDLGNMEVLCCDKTGTLTEGKLRLVSHLNASGSSDNHVLELALLCNSAVIHHKVFGDAIDKTIWDYAQEKNFRPDGRFTKIIEQPFDFEHRAMFTVIAASGRREYIFKGAPDAVLSACRQTDEIKKHHTQVEKWYTEGYRVIAIATKPVRIGERYTFSDAKNLKLAGFILFSDPPKPGVRQALDNLENLGIGLKIITGDNEFVTKNICSRIDVKCDKVLTGPDVDQLSDSQLVDIVWSVDAFARMTPDRKLRVIRALRTGNHTVGYIGDGINDAPALHEADAGISVDTAVDVAKDTASIILLKKNLNVIVDGIREGRRTFSNTLKYILMGTSSNFGNMFSMAGASLLLTFLPMTPPQILLTNAMYDLSQLSIPTDNVDPEELLAPKKWDLRLIKRYMTFFGPISSVYDFLTFGLLYFVFHARGSLFQTGWFVESLMTQILVIFIIRTVRFPFIRSRPGPLLVLTALVMVLIAVVLPYTPLGTFFSLTPLLPVMLLTLFGLTLTYLLIVDLGKRYLLRHLAAHT
jgi:Mg2+-importing ATPase